MFGTEVIQNIMPFGHAANAIELSDGRLFVTWYCGSYEGGEDQRIAGAIRNSDGAWQPSRVVINRFEYDGETWIPEIGVPVQAPGGDVRLFLWACPLSTFKLVRNPGYVRIVGGAGPGAFTGVPTIPFESPVWIRDIPTSRVFVSPLAADFSASRPQLLWDERGLVIMGAARHLQGGHWLLPYHTERKDCWFHSRFFVANANLENWETCGDIYAPPGCLEPVAVQLPSGEILCFMRRGGYDGHIWRASSSDEGRTFSAPVQTSLRNPYAGVDIGFSHTSQRLLVVYNDSYRLRVPLSVGISEDLGQTWRVRDVETLIGQYAYPKLLQTRDGLWRLFYSNDYRHIQHAWFDEAYLEEGRKALG